MQVTCCWQWYSEGAMVQAIFECGLLTRALTGIVAAPASAVVIAAMLAAIPAAPVTIPVTLITTIPACTQQILAYHRTSGKTACLWPEVITQINAVSTSGKPVRAWALPALLETRGLKLACSALCSHCRVERLQ